MNPNTVNVKSTPDEILCRMRYGFNNIEVQLYDRLKDTDPEDCLNAIRKGADISIVHSAILTEVRKSFGDSLSVKNLMIDSSLYRLLDEALDIAESCAVLQGKSVGVVIHNGISEGELMAYGEIIERHVKDISEHLKKHPHTYLLVENEPPVLPQPGGYYIFKECETPESLLMILRMFDQYDVNVNAVIDICHVMMQTMLLNDTFDLDLELDFRPYFEVLNKRIGLIHLNNSKRFGIGRDHGIAFTESKLHMRRLKDVMSLYREYCLGAMITIEVREDDYWGCPDNFVTTKRNLTAVWNELNQT